MRVILLTPSVRPLGARRSLVELIRHLPNEVEPFVVCPGDTGIYLELKDLGVPTAVVPHGAWRKATGRVKSLCLQIPRLRSICGRIRPDVAHANEFHIIPQTFFGGRGKVPAVGHVRLGITPRQVTNYHLGECAQIITVSHAVKELFSGTALYPRVKVVYNGVNTGGISPDGPPHREIADWLDGLGKPRPLVLGLFGLISERKNQLVAVDSVLRARAQGANVALVLAGDAFKSTEAYGDRLRGRIGDTSYIKWLPFQEDAAALYRSIDLNLLISSEEGFGRTIIEAGAAGRPSVGSRIGGIPELIEDGRTGWLVDEGDVEGLADLLVRLDGERNALPAAGGAARTRVQESFTIQAHVRQVVDVWREAMAEK